MRLGEIDLNLKPLKPKFYLCRPDKTVIASLNNIYDTSLSVKFGKVTALNFTIPVSIESDHEQIENPLIEKIRHRYLVKMEYNHQTEYFVFLDQNKQFDDTNENISYKLFGLGYLLGDKQIRDYEATSKTLLEIVNEVLEFTNWQVGYMDSYFNQKFRSHEISSQTVLQAIYELAEKFSAIIVWDTVGLKIDFHMPVNIGMNKGLRFKEGKYLESFSVNSNAEEMVTRLKVYGKEGLTFRKLSPTGANYIESFDWYIYPFERDTNQNIITHSDYFSDSLCIALENYGLAIASVQGQFDTLTASLTAKQDEIQQVEQTLTIRKSELTQILDELDISNSDEFSIPNEHALIIQRRITKEAEITALRNLITTLKNQEAEIQGAINNLRTTTLISSHLSPANLIELNDFIIEKEYTNDTIVDEEDLLEDGLRAFNEMREPKVSMSLDIVNFLSVVEAQHDWHKLSLGDIVKLESKRLRIGIEAKIIEINYNFEADSISLTIANEKELKDDYRKLLDLIYSANATSTAVSMDKFRWDMIEEANTLIDELYLGTINTIKNNITAGYEQNIEVSERGIIIKSPSDPLKQLVIQNGVLALSNNGGNTWSHAITSNGIVGETIIGRLIMGSRLIIEDEDGIIKFSGSLQEIFDENNNLRLAIGNYEAGKYGLKIYSDSLHVSGDSDENLVDTWNNAEQNAKDYADSLRTQIEDEIEDIEARLEDLSNGVGDLFEDGIVTITEKEVLKAHIQQLNTEKTQFDSKYNYVYADVFLTGLAKTNLATAKTDSSVGYDVAHTDLIEAINEAVADSTITEAEKTVVANAFTNYRTRLATLVLRLEEAIASLEEARSTRAVDSAKDYADSLKAQINVEIEDLEERLTELSEEITDAFEDGIISAAEKEALKTHIQQLDNEKSQLDAKYNYIYADSYLVGNAKTNLATAKTDGTLGYNKAHTDLITAINNAIADNIITEAEKLAVTNAFATYRTRLSTLILRFEEAIVSLENARSTRTENNAKAYADLLRADIEDEFEDIENRLNGLSDEIGNIFDDGVVTFSEKEALKSHIELLNTEKTQFDAKYDYIYSDSYLTGTAKTNLETAKTNTSTGYNKAHTDLITAINSAIADNIISEAEKLAVANAFTTYRTRLSTLVLRIEEAITSLENARSTRAENNAKAYADSLKTQIDIGIGNVNTRVTNLNSYVDGAFADGLVSLTEREALETHIQQLNNEKAQLDSKYNSIYNNVKLTGTPKTNLATAKNNASTGYDKAHTDLIAAINNAIADSTITTSERTAVTNGFTAYRTGLSTLSTRFEEAINSIETAMMESAENNAKAYADGLKAQLDIGIGNINTRVTSLNSYVDGAFKDGVISLSEKEALKANIQNLNNEKAQLDAKYNYIYADSYLVGVAKTNLATAKTNATTGYDKAHTDLTTAINNAIADNIITETEKTAVTNAFTTYRTGLSTLVLRLEEAIVSLEIARAVRTESSAIAYTNALRTDIEDEIEAIDLRISSLSGDLGEAFADNIISAAERESLKAHIQQLDNVKAELDSKYTSIYNNSYLTGTTKTNLATAKADNTLGYNKAHTDLITAINSAIADGVIVEGERTLVTNTFNTYRTRLSTLATRFEEAINSIKLAMMAQAEANSKTYTDGKDTTLRSNLRLTAPLPTSLTLDANGITAQTSTLNKFARLDYRGLYIQGGAIQIDGGLPDNQIASASEWNTQGTYIDGSGIYTGIVQATQINATSLSAITANLGTVNAGTLNLSEGLKVVNGTNTVLSVENGQVLLNVFDATVNQKNIVEEIDNKASNNSLQDSVDTILNSVSADLANKIGNETFENFKSIQNSEINLIKNTMSSIQLNSSSILTKVTQTEELVSALGTFRNEIISYMNFSASDMLVIGKSSSPFKIQITNERISFINNDEVLAYMNGNTLYINQAEIKNSILIGKHLMESDNTGTVFRWAGE